MGSIGRQPEFAKFLSMDWRAGMLGLLLACSTSLAAQPWSSPNGRYRVEAVYGYGDKFSVQLTLKGGWTRLFGYIDDRPLVLDDGRVLVHEMSGRMRLLLIDPQGQTLWERPDVAARTSLWLSLDGRHLWYNFSAASCFGVGFGPRVGTD